MKMIEIECNFHAAIKKLKQLKYIFPKYIVSDPFLQNVT